MSKFWHYIKDDVQIEADSGVLLTAAPTARPEDKSHMTAAIDLLIQKATNEQGLYLYLAKDDMEVRYAMLEAEKSQTPGYLNRTFDKVAQAIVFPGWTRIYFVSQESAERMKIRMFSFVVKTYIDLRPTESAVLNTTEDRVREIVRNELDQLVARVKK